MATRSAGTPAEAAASPSTQSSSSRQDSPAALNLPAVAYQPLPPSWRPLMHPGSQALSVPDFYPPKAGQIEEDMSEVHVKHGIQAKQAVSNEGFSAHGLILGLLPTLIPALNTVFGETLQRRDYFASLPSVKHHTFRPPPRVTLNEAKLNAYVRDLADSSVPLSRLAKNIPHGFRGERILEMLWLGVNPSQPTSSQGSSAARQPASPTMTPQPHSVEISRALWFIQCVGASDILARSRSAATASSSSYSVDFTNSCTSWLKKQLAELTDPVENGEAGAVATTAPSTPAATPTAKPPTSANATRPPSSALADEQTRARWAAKWRYSVLLMSTLLANNLLDRRQWVAFIVDAFSSATLAQLAIVLTLVEDWLDDAFESAHLSAVVVAAACNHLASIRAIARRRADDAFARHLVDSLSSILSKTARHSPESFVSFNLWHRHRALLLSELGADLSMRRTLDIAQERSAALFFDHSPSSPPPPAPLHLLMRHLDEFNGDPSAIEMLFRQVMISVEAVVRPRSTIHALLNWATATSRPPSPWRPALIARLLQLLSNRQEKEKRARKKARRSDGSTATTSTASSASSFDLTQCLIAWLEDLDELDESARPVHFEEIVALFSQLTELGLFSYPRFLHRLTARGLAFSSTTTPNDVSPAPALGSRAASSLQVRLLRAIPVPSGSVSLVHQRRLAIYGARAKETREEATHRRALRELGSVFAFLSDGSGARDGGRMTRAEMLSALPHLWQANRFTLSNLLGVHLLPSALQWVSSASVLDIEQTALLLSVMEEAQHWGHVVELMSAVLQRLTDGSQTILTVVAQIKLVRAMLDCHAKIWATRRPYAGLATRLAALDSTLSKSEERAPLPAAALQAFTSTGDLTVLQLIIERIEGQAVQHDAGSPAAPDAIAAFEAFLRCAVESNAEATLLEAKDRLLRSTFSSASRTRLDASLRGWTSPIAQPNVDLVASTLSQLCTRGCLSTQELVDTLVLPGFAVAAVRDLDERAQDDDATIRLALGISLLRFLYSRDEASPSSRTLSQDILLRAVLCQTEPASLLRVAVYVAGLASFSSTAISPAVSADDATAILTAVCSQDSLRDLIIAQPSVLRDQVHATLPFEQRLEALSLLLRTVRDEAMPSSLLGQDPLKVEVSSLTAAATSQPLDIAFLVEELGIVLARLTSQIDSDTSKEREVDDKVQELASALLQPLFLVDGAASLPHGLRLWQIGGNRLQTAIVDMGLRAAAASLSNGSKGAAAADDHGETRAVLSLQAILAMFKMLLLDACEGQRLPATSAESAEDLFDRVCFGLGSISAPLNKKSWTESAPITTLLQLLVLASRSSAFWSSSKIRSKLPHLIAITLTQQRLYSLALTAQPGTAEEDEYLQLRDVVVYLQVEMPADMLGSVSALMQQQAAEPPGPSFADRFNLASEAEARNSLWSSRVEQMRRLLPSSPASKSSATADLIVAPSLQAALERGEWSPAPDKPWSWTMPLESVATESGSAASPISRPGVLPLQTSTSTPAVLGPYASVHAKYSHPLTLPPLANHLSLPLSLFQPRRTTDTPSDPAADHRTLDAVRRGVTSAGDEADEGWRALRSERGEEDWREEYGDLDERLRRADEEEKGDTPDADARTEEESRMASLSRFVGLPNGPVRTLDAFLTAQRQRMASSGANQGAASSSGGSSAAAATTTAPAAGTTKKRARAGSTASNASSAGGGRGGKGDAANEGDGSKVAAPARKRKNSTSSAAGGGRKRRNSSASASGEGEAGGAEGAGRGRGRGRGGAGAGGKKRGG